MQTRDNYCGFYEEGKLGLWQLLAIVMTQFVVLKMITEFSLL